MKPKQLRVLGDQQDELDSFFNMLIEKKKILAQHKKSFMDYISALGIPVSLQDLLGYTEKELTDTLDGCNLKGPLAANIRNELKNIGRPNSDVLYRNNRYHCFLIEASRSIIGHLGVGFHCDILIDTGSSFEIILPLPKIRQLKLQPGKSFKAEGMDKNDILMQTFSPDVTVILMDERRTPHQFSLKASSVGVLSVEETNEMTSIATEHALSVFESQSDEASYIITLSPVLEREEKYAKEIPVIGFPGLVRMGVEIDFKENTMYKARLRV